MIFSKYKVTSLFGYRTLANGDERYHNGIDIVGVENKNILSPIDGIVKSSTIVTNKSNATWEWGNYVRIDSKDGYKHYFCHLASRSVKVGDHIKIGDTIGIMGNTGYSFGEHTHYGIRNEYDIWIDPAGYFKKELKENIIYMANFSNNEDEAETKINELEKNINLLNEEIKRIKQDRRYKTISEMPAWMSVYVEDWINKGIIKGNENGELDITDDMVRCLIFTERMLKN